MIPIDVEALTLADAKNALTVRLLTSSGNTINASFVDNTAFPFSTSAGNPLAKGFNAKVGVDGKWGESTNISLSYGVALQDGHGVAHTGQAQIKVPF